MNTPTHTLRYSLIGFPGCCGIKAIVGLSTVPITQTQPKIDWEEVCHRQNNNTLVATTIEDQLGVNKILEEDGWVKQELAPNPNTGNILYFWTYTKQTLLKYEEPEIEYDDEEDEEDTY